MVEAYVDMNEAVIVEAVRTAQGKFDGTLKGFSAPQLGGIVIKEAVRRTKIQPQQVNEVIMGNVVSAGLGQNVARQAAIAAGLPYEVGCFHIDKVCGSSLKAVILAAQAIKLGDADCIIRRRHGEHDQQPVPARQGTIRISHLRREDHRFHGP